MTTTNPLHITTDNFTWCGELTREVAERISTREFFTIEHSFSEAHHCVGCLESIKLLVDRELQRAIGEVSA